MAIPLTIVGAEMLRAELQKLKSVERQIQRIVIKESLAPKKKFLDLNFYPSFFFDFTLERIFQFFAQVAAAAGQGVLAGAPICQEQNFSIIHNQRVC